MNHKKGVKQIEVDLLKVETNIFEVEKKWHLGQCFWNIFLKKSKFAQKLKNRQVEKSLFWKTVLTSFWEVVIVHLFLFQNIRCSRLTATGDVCRWKRPFCWQTVLGTWFAPILLGRSRFKPYLGLVTSCCSHQTAWWRPACSWLGWGSTSIGTIRVGGFKKPMLQQLPSIEVLLKDF